MEAAFFVLIVFVSVFAVAVFASIPGRIARDRQHSQATAISVCAVIGVLTLGVFWLVALVWAFTEDNRHPAAKLPTRPAADTYVPQMTPHARQGTPCSLCGAMLEVSPGHRSRCPHCGALVAT